MNATELATAMLEWQSLTEQANALGARIKAAVFDLEKTQSVGNVTAKYSSGRAKYDYQRPGEDAPQDTIDAHTETKTITKTDWRKVCTDAKIDGLLVERSAPTVTLKLGG